MPGSITRKPIFLVIFIILLILAFGMGIQLWHRFHPKPSSTPPNHASVSTELESGTSLRPQALPEFQLLSGADQSFTNKNLIGHYSLLFFGFTHCRGICPITLSLLTRINAQLKNTGLPLPQVVFITLDPQRDKPGVVAKYAKAFNKDFIGISGTDAAIRRFSQQMGVVALRMQADDANDDYQIDHSGTLYLINPQGQLLAVFSPPLKKEGIIHDYKALLAK